MTRAFFEKGFEEVILIRIKKPFSLLDVLKRDCLSLEQPQHVVKNVLKVSLFDQDIPNLSDSVCNAVVLKVLRLR